MTKEELIECPYCNEKVDTNVIEGHINVNHPDKISEFQETLSRLQEQLKSSNIEKEKSIGEELLKESDLINNKVEPKVGEVIKQEEVLKDIPADAPKPKEELVLNEQELKVAKLLSYWGTSIDFAKTEAKKHCSYYNSIGIDPVLVLSVSINTSMLFKIELDKIRKEFNDKITAIQNKQNEFISVSSMISKNNKELIESNKKLVEHGSNLMIYKEGWRELIEKELKLMKSDIIGAIYDNRENTKHFELNGVSIDCFQFEKVGDNYTVINGAVLKKFSDNHNGNNEDNKLIKVSNNRLQTTEEMIDYFRH